MTVKTLTDDGVPVFGTNVDLEGTIDFEVEALHVPTWTRQRHRFTSWRDPGPDFVLTFVRAGNDDRAAMNAAAVLLNTALIDHDGLPADAVKPEEGEEPGDWTDNVEEWSSKRRFLHLAESDDYRVAAMALVDIAKYLAEQGLKRASTPVAGAGGAVPTAAPARSPRGRTATRSGSTAKRSRKAST
jgi:hypothetical protein